MEEEKKDVHKEPLFRRREQDEGTGWTLNFENPYAGPFMIFGIGIIPSLMLAVQFENIYIILGFLFLVILPFIIRKFKKP